MRFISLISMTTLFCSPLFAQEAVKLDRATQEKMKAIVGEMSAAMKTEDESDVRRVVQQFNQLLGSQAGLPESPDEYRPVPETARPLTVNELTIAFDDYIPYIERRKWWQTGLDPSKTNHSLREVASVIEGCLAARQISAANSEKLLAIAKDAGDFLVWTQDQAGTGILPFPAVRNGKGRPFEVAEAFFRRAERNGTLDQVIHNGWVIDDFDDGGLQFDNGLAGVALVHLYEATMDEEYKRSAIRAADWAIERRVVTNWNYNSFSVFLLAEVYRITGEEKYLASAKEKAMLGVLPGQLTEGPSRGRWGDPHNARPAYHYIMIRGLAALSAVMPSDDPDQANIVECLRLALLARNSDFQKGIFNADSSVEALIRVKMQPTNVASKLTECRTDEALATLERYAAEGFRMGKPPLSPGAWGQLLAYRYQIQTDK
jgi:23S rRNA A1618 N6-methylase RlmF